MTSEEDSAKKFALEENLAKKFAPTYFSSANERQYLVELEPEEYPKISLCYPPWKPCIYYSIFGWTIDNQNFYEINYFSIWDRDSGLRGHIWDTERTALLIKGPVGDIEPSSFEAQEAYFAAHEGEGPFNRSKYIEPPMSDRGIVVYWSLDKHASYPSFEDANEYSFFERFEKPENRADPTKYTPRNIGRIEEPNPSTPWIKYEGAWGPDGVCSVYSKLTDPIWTPELGSSKWHRNLPGEEEAKEEIKRFQMALELQANGMITEELCEKICVLPDLVIRNASKLSVKDIAELTTLKPMKTKDLKGWPLKSLMAPKQIEGSIDGINGASAVNIGKKNRVVYYAIIHPKDKKMFCLRTASIKTINNRKINSLDLHELP